MPVIKDEALLRADQIDAEMDWPRGLAAGRLVNLWGRAQAGKGTSSVRRRLLASWALLELAEADRFIAAAVRVHFLEPTADKDVFLIVGNDAHVDKIEEFRKNKVLAGKISASARQAKHGTSAPLRTDREQPVRPVRGSVHEQKDEQNTNRGPTEHEPSSSSFSSSSSSPVTSSSSGPVPTAQDKRARAYDPPATPHPADSPPAAPPVPIGGAARSVPSRQTAAARSEKGNGVQTSEPGTDGSRVWGAYAVAYASAYGHAPERNAKNNRHCADLVKRLGVENAEAVVRFYVTHRKAYYVGRTHPLDLCLQDAEGLLTQLRAGHRITNADARRVDDGQTNEQTFAAVSAKLKAEGILR